MKEPKSGGKKYSFWFRAYWYFWFQWDMFWAKRFWKKISRDFTKMYWYLSGRTYKQTYWFGVRALKNPMDMWVYQEILYETQPDILVETGTAEGGSALFFAHIFDLIGHGKVLTVDIEKQHNLNHPRIQFFHGSSTDPAIFQKIERLCRNKKVMVVLDSDHSKEHVAEELQLYAPLVSKGCYLVMEDTLLGQNFVITGGHKSVIHALREWLPQHPNFVRDKNREKFMSTFYPDGWLLRKE